MTRLRKSLPLLTLIAAPFVLYQLFYFGVRKPLNDALIESVKRNDLTQAELLLSQGADVNSHDSTRFQSCTDLYPARTGYTPLILSTFAYSRPVGNLAMMNLLLQHGADPNIGDNSNSTPLHSAASIGSSSFVETLIAHGADVNAKESNGDTPLIKAARGENRDVIKALLFHGADVNTTNFRGDSALAKTTGYRNDIETMKLLLAHGADVNNRNGVVPLAAATNYGCVEAILILLQHGADTKVNDGEISFKAVRSYRNRLIKNPRSKLRGIQPEEIKEIAE